MLHIVKVLLFLFINLAGYFTIPVLINVAVIMGVFPAVPDSMQQSFGLWLTGGGMWAWIGSALLSIGYFFAQGELRAWLILAPLYIPAIYSLLVMLYFGFAATH